MKKNRKIRRMLKLLGAWKEYKQCSGKNLPSKEISADFIFGESPSGYKYWKNIDKTIKQCI